MGKGPAGTRTKLEGKHVESVDPVTGEVFEGVVPVTVRRSTSRPVNPFFLAQQDGFERIACDPDLSHDARRVLLLMMAHLEYDNAIAITQQQTCELLHLDKSRVSRAVRQLVSKELVWAIGRSGRHLRYKLHSGIGWKGKLRDLAK